MRPQRQTVKPDAIEFIDDIKTKKKKRTCAYVHTDLDDWVKSVRLWREGMLLFGADLVGERKDTGT